MGFNEDSQSLVSRRGVSFCEIEDETDDQHNPMIEQESSGKFKVSALMPIEEFNEIDTKVVAMTILTSLQGINWFCLYEDTQVSAENYLKTSMKLLIKSLKRGS